MPRRARVTSGGLAYHVLNRSVAGLSLFRKQAEAIQIGIARNRPYGDESWQETQAKQLGLSHTMRREG